MAISELTSQRNTADGVGISTTITFTYPSTPTQGNLLVAAFTWRQNGTVTDVPTGWNLATNTGNANSLDGAIYYKIAAASEPTIAQWTLSASIKSSGVAGEWSGVESTSPLDQVSNGSGGSATALDSGTTGILAQADELVISVFGSINAVTHTLNESQITVGTAQAGGTPAGSLNTTTVGSKIVSSTTAINHTASSDVAQIWTAGTATFKAAASGIDVSLSGQSASASLQAIGSVGFLRSINGHSINYSQSLLGTVRDKSLTGQSILADKGSIGKDSISNLVPNILSVSSENTISNIIGSINGQNIVSNLDNLAKSNSTPLTSNNITVSKSTVITNILANISGQSVTTTRGIIIAIAEFIATLTGVSISTALGSVGNNNTANLTSNNTTISAGTIINGLITNISSQTLSIAKGIIIPGLGDVTAQLVGLALNTSHNIISISRINTVNGNHLVSSTNSIANNRITFVSGSSISIDKEPISSSRNSTLSGNSVGVGKGSLLINISKAIISSAVSISRGTVVAGLAYIAQLVGVALSVQQNNLVSSASNPLTSNTIVVFKDSIVANIFVNTVGQSVSVARGIVTTVSDSIVILLGQALSITKGSTNNSLASAINSNSLTIDKGLTTSSNIKALAGHVAMVSKGVITPFLVRIANLIGVSLTAAKGSISKSLGNSLTSATLTLQTSSIYIPVITAVISAIYRLYTISGGYTVYSTNATYTTHSINATYKTYTIDATSI